MRAVETAATKARNRPAPVRKGSVSESAKVDFVNLLPRLQSPDYSPGYFLRLPLVTRGWKSPKTTVSLPAVICRQ